MFLRIDDWLFSRVFQPFADWFCDHTGRNPFYLAATCMYLYIAGIVAGNVMFKHSWIMMILSASICIFMGYVAFSYDRDSIAPSKATGTLNRDRANGLLRFLRAYSFVTLPLDVVEIFVEHQGKVKTHSDELDFFLSVMFLLFLYFEACEQKPPAPPKKKLQTKLARATS